MKYYICNMDGKDGISRYARQFFRHILEPGGYVHLDSEKGPEDILSLVTSEDTVHVESGIFNYNEQEILVRMLESGYTKVRITMHDPPLFRYPSYQTPIRPVNMLIKYSDRHLGGQRRFRSLLMKAQKIYVLSARGQAALQKTYRLENTCVLSHIVPTPLKPGPRPEQPDLMYMGFIGKNKGLEYALEVHARLLKYHPGAQFRIAGTAIGEASAYLDSLRSKNERNVQFLGYVPEPKLTELCIMSAFAFLPFRNYRGYVPVSGSILFCMEKGTLVAATPVNAIPEIIKDGKNGLLLTGDPASDAKKIQALWDDEGRYERLRLAAYDNILRFHSPGAIANKLID